MDELSHHQCAGRVPARVTASDAPTVDLPVAAGSREKRQRRGQRSSARPAEETDANIGRVLSDQYLVLQRIGWGGMGTVYMVEHLSLKKRFAAKILAPEMARRPASVARFEIEAVSASRLDHDNIVNVVNFGRDGQLVYLIMELLRGEPLDARLQRGPVEAAEAVAIMLPVCRALAAAHAAGIVHRDIKPANVFLAARGEKCVVKVLDFGVSKIREAELAEARLTQTGQVLGSPLYMSPEAARGALDVDARADVYSVGVVLYELCTGQPPFHADNFLQILQQHINATPPALRALDPSLPEALERVVMRALAKDRKERQQTMAELEDELRAVFPAIDPEAPLALSWEPLEHSLALTASSTSPTTVGGWGRSWRVWTRRLGKTRWRFAVAFAALAAVAAVALWLGRTSAERAGEREVVAVPVPVALTPMPAESAPGPAPAPTLPPASPASPASPALPPAAPVITLSVETHPPGADVIVDGVWIGKTPLSVPFPASERARELHVQLAGYRAEARTLTFAQSRRLSLDLERRRARTPVAPGPTPPADPEIKEGR